MPPRQKEVSFPALATTNVFTPMFMEYEAAHPCESVICTESIPEHIPEMFCVVCADGNQTKVYGVVPPAGVKLTAPLHVLMQDAFTTVLVDDTVNGLVSVTVPLPEQWCASESVSE